MLTFVGGVSVTASTTDEFPEDCDCEPSWLLVVMRQPANAAQSISSEIVKSDRNRTIAPLQQLCGLYKS
jgi:hypothetical protein